MYRASTPTHLFDIGMNTADLEKILITYSQDGQIVLEKTKADCQLGETTISVTLTQEETNLFSSIGAVEIQIRVLTNGGKAIPSEVFAIPVSRVLNDEVM